MLLHSEMLFHYILIRCVHIFIIFFQLMVRIIFLKLFIIIVMIFKDNLLLCVHFICIYGKFISVKILHSISRSTTVASTRSKYSVAIICFCCRDHLLVLSHLNQQRHVMVFICLRVYHEIILLYYFLLLFLFVLVLLLLHKNLLPYI